MSRAELHAWVASIRLSIAGDLAAAERYAEAGRTADALASTESAAWWEAQIAARLQGRRYHGQAGRAS